MLRERGGKYKVKWKGRPLSEATWEPAENLRSSGDLIAEFEDQQEHAAAKRKEVASPGGGPAPAPRGADLPARAGAPPQQESLRVAHREQFPSLQFHNRFCIGDRP